MLGDRLKALRTGRGLTLRQLSERTGLSVSMLSQIESGAADPSLGSLRTLANVFEASIATLFSDPDAPNVHISRPGSRHKLIAGDAGYAYERLTPGRGDLEVLHADIPPGLSSSPHPWAHPSTECAFVVRGRLVVEVGAERVEIGAGESVTFDSREPHRYINESAEPTEIIIAVTPPSP
ncbi:XRE family transcriptional regulator [Leifsonia sp. F6_8S_P_1B]|uniref:XRE family transcriptional regulator n=1 Tax=Leifsonia williamsii TaxID=3035919 RepID=A0ABT8KDQ0_9MICO|nr:XRE family transcriptional regulator [Leifsonia williamsii]MDN4614582.1 XRE family transcriptional regulator [Leifsonia williamsii]